MRFGATFSFPFVSAQKQQKRKDCFVGETSVSRRGSEATEIIWRKSGYFAGLFVFVGSTTALFRAATLQSPGAEAPQSGLEGRSRAL
jgi:hypothetical protein